MGFCSLSSELNMDSYTLVENSFISEYLPSAPDYTIRVYLYGLFLSTSPSLSDNTIENMTRVLNLTEEELHCAYEYWQDKGLVQIIESKPFVIKYLPLKSTNGKATKYSVTKYKDFNKQLQSILTREVKPNEYNEYYTFIEKQHFEPEALIMIVKYCVTQKGADINFHYILSVAKSYATEGIKTTKGLEEKFMELELISAELTRVLKTLGITRSADIEERNLYVKWTKAYGFTNAVISHVASLQNRRGGMMKLDEQLTRLHELRLFTIEDVDNLENTRDSLLSLAKTITNTLGLYYQSLDNIINTYILDWTQKGFAEDALQLIASYCFKHSIRTFEGMNAVVLKFYKLGLVNTDSIGQHVSQLVSTDENISQILETCGIIRNVNSWDRAFYRTWTYSWNISDEIIMYLATLSKGKTQPMQYLNRLLSTTNEKGLKTLKDVKEKITLVPETGTNVAKQFMAREYNEKQLEALFDSLDNIEV
ncbi:MAG: DnaD domain protein [Clostridia bacterium]